jgi:GT2 family glycosyltransferase
MNNKLAIIIPTYNRRAVTEDCVSRLIKGTYSDIHIIICDSDSSDGTQNAFADFHNVTTLNVGATSWWAAAVNRGIEYALQMDAYESILVLNDDIDIPLTLIEQLFFFEREYPNKIISPAQKSSTGLFLGMNYSKWIKKSQIIYAEGVTNSIEVESTNGCCLLIPVVVFKTVGLFDELNCPHLAADVEFQIRAGRLGYKTIACPDIIIAQHKSTDYYKKALSLRTLFSSKGSPVHLAAYLKYGETLFNGRIKFLMLGLPYHYRYIKTLVKMIIFSFQRARRSC